MCCSRTHCAHWVPCFQGSRWARSKAGPVVWSRTEWPASCGVLLLREVLWQLQALTFPHFVLPTYNLNFLFNNRFHFWINTFFQLLIFKKDSLYDCLNWKVKLFVQKTKISINVYLLKFLSFGLLGVHSHPDGGKWS